MIVGTLMGWVDLDGLHRHVVAAQTRRAGTGESRQRRWIFSSDEIRRN